MSEPSTTSPPPERVQSRHYLRQLYQTPQPTEEPTWVKAEKFHLSQLSSAESKDVVIHCGAYTWLIHEHILGASCTRLSLLLEVASKIKDVDWPTLKLILDLSSSPLAMEKALVYWYTRKLDVKTDFTIKHAQKRGAPLPTVLPALDRLLLVLDIAGIAVRFGDEQLQDILFRPFSSLLTQIKAHELGVVVKMCFGNTQKDGEEYDGFRDLLALHVVRNNYDRFNNPDSYIITHAMASFPKFKEKMISAIQAEAEVVWLPAEVHPEDPMYSILMM